MALSLYHRVLCARTSPKTVSQVRKLNSDHTIVSFPFTKLNRHFKATTSGSSVLLGHNHNLLRTYATTTFTLMQQDVNAQFYEKLDEAQRLLRSTSDPVQSLLMVDAIQRLGIDGYFQDQIQAVLLRHHLSYSSSNYDDPHHASLRFRLLRQHGFHVSADVFDKFKDGGEHYNKGLKHDIRGLMGLFEASQLSCDGEDSLEEVGNMSKKILTEKLAHHELEHYQARVVRNRLAYPFHTSLPRFMAKDYLNELQATDEEWSNIFKGLHIWDSIKLKSLHQTEIMQVSKWWKELGLAEEMKLARNEPAEWYMWAMGMVTDPSLSALRVELSKPISLIYIFDDIFDVYGTLEELALFTDVIERWDLDALEQLPEYMRICFIALNDTTNEISYRIFKEHGWNPVQSLRLTWGMLCKAYLVEARWFGSGEVPKADEYLKNGTVTSGVHVALVHLFFLLGQNVTHQSAQLVNLTPSIISSTATILRLWDDLASVEDGHREGEEGSYLKYYMKEHKGVTTEDAKAHAVDEISKAWRELNGACISPSPFSKTYKDGCLNLARMCPLMYNYDEHHQLPILKAHMRSLLS